jgi:hypothetical protein
MYRRLYARRIARRRLHQPRHRTQFLQQWLGSGHIAVAAESWRVHRVQRTVTHRLKDQITVAYRGRRHHHDHTRRLLHHLPRRLRAVHPRHDEVHQHNVRPFRQRKAHRLIAGVCRPDDLKIRLLSQNAAQHLSGGP